MEGSPRKAWLSVAFSLLLVIIPACSTYQAQQAIEARQREFLLNNEAWQAARSRQRAMCPKAPETLKIFFKEFEEKFRGGFPIDRYQEIPKIEAQPNNCNARIIKLTNAPISNDWVWDWVPSYETIVSIHEEELRRLVTPKLYEEYMLGLSRYLAAKADTGEITPPQLTYTFNEGWKWMVGKMKEESALLLDNLKAAQLSDAQARKMVGEIAVGLAAVATAALVASAAASTRAAAEANARAAEASAYRPSAPTTCYAYPSGAGMYYVRCY